MPRGDGLAGRIARRVALVEGLVPEAEVWAEVIQMLQQALERGDPDAAGVVRGLVARDPLSEPLVGELAWLARRAAGEVDGRPTAWAEVGGTLRADLTERVGEALAGAARTAVGLLAALPAAWCTPEMLRLALAADVGEDRCGLDRRLLPAALHLLGDGAFDALVRRHLASGAPEAAALLADAYRPELSAEHRTELAARLLRRPEACPTDALLRCVVRMSVEGADERAVPLATHLAGRPDLPPSAPPVLGLVVWLGGAHEEGRRLAHVPPGWRDDFGWATQASRAVAAFLDASAADARGVLELCARGDDAERPRSSVAAVGALVGRLAVMRMRAYLALGDRSWAAREAGAVIAFHGYRGYDLHMQGAHQEFDAALTDRLAVTPTELDEARVALAAAGADVDDVGRLVLSEGVLLLRPGAAGV